MKLDALLDRLVQDLSNAAREDLEAAAAHARLDAEQAAEAKLAVVRAEGEARLSGAQAVNAGLLEDVEGARQEVKTVQAAAQAEIDSTRAELEARLTSTRAELEAQLLNTRTEFEARVEQIEQERTQALLARDVTGAHLEAETRRASELAEALEVGTRRASELAETLDAETRRGRELAEALDAETRRASELDEMLKAETRRTSELAGALDAARHKASLVKVGAGASSQDRQVMLDRIRGAIRSIDRATSPSDILETLIEALAHDFARVAVFAAGPSSFTGWQGRGFRSTADISHLVMPRASDSLLTRAVTNRKRVSAEGSARNPVRGLSGSSVARAVALPVLAQDRVIAVVYAEDAAPSRETSTSFPGFGCTIAEMLIDHAALRLTAKQHAPSSEPTAAARTDYSPVRAAHRVRIQEDIEVTLDGASSSLIDLSAVGAQVLSPNAMRPNRVVKMTLRSGDTSVACKGRVMWSRFEQPRGKAASHYRVGVKFTEIEPQAIESFLIRHGIGEEASGAAPEAAKATL